VGLNVETNNAAATMNLDLRSNRATAGTVDFQLTNTLGTFNSSDHANVDANNDGTVSDAGVINDIGDNPVAQPTP
jgi:hypothetical protein